ncbi:MAG: TRAP transporter substrate-binding protein [Deltaproteobacteria bacterium]|nr:TRAP transporter substrate-binding protein [Deltaproteobacteria bacterium]
MKRLCLIFLFVFLFSTFSIFTYAKPIVLRLGHVVSTKAPYHVGALRFAKLLKEKTKGNIIIDIYPGGQLARGEREIIEQLQFGGVDLVVTSTGPVGGFVPSMLVVDLPFLFKDNNHVDKVLEGEIGKSLLEKLSKAGIKGLAFWENGFRNLTNSKRPINLPEDVKGLKIRTMENQVHIDSFRALGADPTPMAWGEVYTALQQGVIDGQENPINIIRTLKIYEVQKYLALTGHFYSPALILMNKKKFDKMPKNYKKALVEAAWEAGRYEKNFIRKNEARMLKELKELGMVVTTPDKSLFRKATESVYKKYENRFGKDLINKIINTK